MSNFKYWVHAIGLTCLTTSVALGAFWLYTFWHIYLTPGQMRVIGVNQYGEAIFEALFITPVVLLGICYLAWLIVKIPTIKGGSHGESKGQSRSGSKGYV